MEPAKHSPHSHSLRKGRVSTSGGMYLVTTATAGHVHLFADFERARIMTRGLFNSSETLGVCSYA